VYRESKTYQKPKNLKWRVICAGVENLIKEKGLKAEDVVLWVDWQSIYQDDKEEKMKGLRSLIKYRDQVRDAVRLHAGADRGGGAGVFF